MAKQPDKGDADKAPPPPDAKTDAPEQRAFVARFNILRGGVTTPPGESLDLTRVEYDLLKPQGAIDGDWD